jgi:BirA family biotin operon repressor/biotin-[acetyl-CoA-carboxylase] ligase
VSKPQRQQQRKRLSTETEAMGGGAAFRQEFAGPSEPAGDWPSGVGRIILDETSSTFDAARMASAPPPFWVMAHRQTAARGRRGRPWAMPEGNFAATLVLTLSDPPMRRALRSFLMALALHRTLDHFARGAGWLALKWPNDVLLNGGKVAGILLESDDASRLSVGVGVNLAAGPDRSALETDALPAVSLLEETGVHVTPEAFLTVLAQRFMREEARFVAEGFEPARADWLARAVRLGETITARLPEQSFTGRFEGIDREGMLLLVTGDGLKRIAAADIYF